MVMVPLFNHYYKLQRGVFSVWHHRRGSTSCKSSQETFWAGFFFPTSPVRENVLCRAVVIGPGRGFLGTFESRHDEEKKKTGKNIELIRLSLDAAQGMQKVLIFIFTLCLKENVRVAQNPANMSWLALYYRSEILDCILKQQVLFCFSSFSSSSCFTCNRN